MPARLHMKLGILAETDRLPDSADSITVVEPSIGSITRTKGGLYLLVTGIGGRKLRDATRIVSETIRTEYYYDESAGIAVCLGKAIRLANKRLLHGDRYTGKRGEPAPIGVAVAVVRNGELYVATVGPAEAYLVRQARLLTLPEGSSVAGLPTGEPIEVEVWHGEMAVGDSLILVSPNLARQVGLSPMQDAVVTLHPQPAVDQLHRLFASGGGSGSDGIIAIEATQIAATQKTRPLKPVWPAEPHAGTPDHSPIPLADTVVDGVSAVQTSAREARTKAGGVFRGLVDSILDAMPARSTHRGRVTSMMVRRERERRLAVGVIGLCLLIAVVATFVSLSAGPRREDLVDNQTKARQAYQAVQKDLEAVSGSGRNLLESNPKEAGRLLKDAWAKLDDAARYGYQVDQLTPLRAQVTEGLNHFYGVIYVKPSPVVSFGQDSLTQTILGPDGYAYVIDASQAAVYRVDLVAKTKSAIAAKGDQLAGGIVGTPRLLAVGGPDVLMLDDHNALWRWRPNASDKTKGTLLRIPVDGSSSWSGNIRAIGTFVTNVDAGLYTLYVVEPAAKTIKKYPAAFDGSRFSSGGPNYLSVDQDVSDVDDMLIDGSVYLAEGGRIVRYDQGQTQRNWGVKPPDDGFLRSGTPRYARIASPSAKDTGNIYAYDSVNKRVLAFDKASGNFVEQYMAAGGTTAFANMGEMFVLTAATGASPTLFWTEGGSLMSASLNPQPVTPQASATALPLCGPKASLKPGTTAAPTPVCATAAPSPKATAKP